MVHADFLLSILSLRYTLFRGLALQLSRELRAATQVPGPCRVPQDLEAGRRFVAFLQSTETVLATKYNIKVIGSLSKCSSGNDRKLSVLLSYY